MNRWNDYLEPLERFQHSQKAERGDRSADASDPLRGKRSPARPRPSSVAPAARAPSRRHAGHRQGDGAAAGLVMAGTTR